MRRTGPTNIMLRKLIKELKKASNKYKAPVWDYVADLLSKPSRDRVVVNLGRLNRYVSDGDVVVVPGKVLGVGSLNKKITLAVASISLSAADKVKASGSRLMHIRDLLNEDPEGKGVKVIV
ncbi:MAG: 50S ribosomal protein L18e [Sulfolobales archaeon]|nr:50S ribosomal protein L18e [Sulfolobales archaeon]MDW7969860.1 50S ribosomal protein L18e [Sulfolobales archaeon]